MTDKPSFLHQLDDFLAEIGEEMRKKQEEAKKKTEEERLRQQTEHTERMTLQISQTMYNMSTMLDAVVEGLVGYRNKLRKEGFTEESAEKMVVEYHRGIMNAIFTDNS